MSYGFYTLPDGRNAGYTVEAECDTEGCSGSVYRGFDDLCGESPLGSRDSKDWGCSFYFCSVHKDDHDCPNPRCGVFSVEGDLCCGLIENHPMPHEDAYLGGEFTETEADEVVVDDVQRLRDALLELGHRHINMIRKADNATIQRENMRLMLSEQAGRNIDLVLKIQKLEAKLKNAEEANQRVLELTNKLSWSPNMTSIVQRYRKALSCDVCLECVGTGDVEVRFSHGIQTQDCAQCGGSGVSERISVG